MKYIDISTKKYPNTFALVDDCDYEELNKYRWHAVKASGGLIYANRTPRIKGKNKPIKMHTAIMGHVDGKQVDHRSGDTLDNQRANLRHCSHAENMMNRKINSNNTSGYKGVSWDKAMNKWLASIQLNGKSIHIGYFFCLIKAAKAYDTAAVELFGEFARLNFPSKS